MEEDEIGLLKEVIAPKKKIPTLLKRLVERPPEAIDYIGTSYGLTKDLLRFWKSLKFVPLYVGQKSNDLTGEHSCIMLYINEKETAAREMLHKYFIDFRARIIKLSKSVFREFPAHIGLSLLDNKQLKLKSPELSRSILNSTFIHHDFVRLESYSKNMVDFRLILDLVDTLASLYFEGKVDGVDIDALQKAILFGMGVQGKNVDKLCSEFNMPADQVLAKFYNMVKKISKRFNDVIERDIEKELMGDKDIKDGSEFIPISLSLDDELNETASILAKQQKDELKKLKTNMLQDYAIKGTEEEWAKALSGKRTNLVSVKR